MAGPLAASRALQSLETLREEFSHLDLPHDQPFRLLALKALETWRRILTEAGAAGSGRAAATRLLNPYQAGPPVKGPLFVGRGPLISSLLEIWDIRLPRRDSVLLFGHRRTGKTSILINLHNELGERALCAYVDLQRLALETTTAGFLFRVASLAVADLAERGRVFSSPNRETFKQAPSEAFDKFLADLRRKSDGQPFFLLLDELEVLAEGLRRGRYEPALLTYLRSVIMGESSWLSMAFAARHTFVEEEMHFQARPLFGSVRILQVDLLAPEHARSLLHRPHPEFIVDYTTSATERILWLTGGQPYLLQLFGWHLVSRLNSICFDQGVERPFVVECNDVGDVLEKQGFWGQVDAYGDGVLHELDVQSQSLLKHIVHQGRGLKEEDPLLATGLSTEELEALEYLRRHDVIRSGDNEGHCYLSVPLLGTWMQRQQHGCLPG